MKRTLTFFIAALLLSACADPQPVTITVIGVNDVHGQLIESGRRGGLVTISGYVNAARAAREGDGGSLLLIDAGDMWQGTLDSNLSEGAAMVDAYNALGFTAATIGNHEFDFGPVGPAATPSEPGHDPRGALKARTAQANFPVLAANLVDTDSNELVDWENVQPTALIDVQGIKIGIIGLMTERALQRTAALNVGGLRVAPLAPAIVKYGTNLRAAGADIIIVTAHAGGECTEFTDPMDLSSCTQADEIFRVARDLPAGLVDIIIAGHVHQAIAHFVNDIAITSSYSNTIAFGRVDFSVNPKTREVLKRTIFPPHLAIPGEQYEGQIVTPDPAVLAIAERAAQQAKERRESPLGIRLETPFTLRGNPESSLGNLFTDALWQSLDVDIVIHNVSGGLRTGLTAGELRFGDVYQLSPFENRLVIFEMSGADLRKVVAEQAHLGRRSMGFSGMVVETDCSNLDMDVRMVLANGNDVADDDTVRVAVNDYIATGGDDILTNVMPDGGYAIDQSAPLTRDVFVDWLTAKGGSIHADDYQSYETPKWTRPDVLDPACRLPN